MAERHLTGASTSAREVKLRYYDVSRGWASGMSTALIGCRVEGIWHTGVEVFGLEFFFGGGGVQRMHPSAFEAEQCLKPSKVVVLGETGKALSELDAFVRQVSPRFTTLTYDLLDWNCNHFSNEIVKFLLNGKEIPVDVIQQHRVLNNSPAGQMILQMIRAANLANPVGPPSSSQSTAASSDIATPDSSASRGHYDHDDDMSSAAGDCTPTVPLQTAASCNPRQFEATLERLLQRTASSTKCIAVLQFLEEACIRVIRNATSPERRRLMKANNPPLRDLLCSTEEGILTLMALGFVESGDAWVFPSPTKAALEAVVKSRAVIRAERRKLQPLGAAPPKDGGQFATQIAQLARMGFSNPEECYRALEAANGNLNGALDRLLCKL